jgi:hypothetical protein
VYNHLFSGANSSALQDTIVVFSDDTTQIKLNLNTIKCITTAALSLTLQTASGLSILYSNLSGLF